MFERKLTLVEEPPIVSIEGLCKSFDQVKALDHVSLEIPEGKIIGLLGPNGSGKTTLLKILAGLYTAYEGNVSIDGNRPGEKTKAIVSYLPDRPAFSLKQTPAEILEIYTAFFADFNKERFLDLMEKFELDLNTPV